MKHHGILVAWIFFNNYLWIYVIWKKFMGIVSIGLNETTPCDKLPWLFKLSSHFMYVSWLIFNPNIYWPATSTSYHLVQMYMHLFIHFNPSLTRLIVFHTSLNFIYHSTYFHAKMLHLNGLHKNIRCNYWKKNHLNVNRMLIIHYNNI